MKRGLLVMAVLGLLVSVGCGDDGDGGGGGSPAGSGGGGGSAGSGGTGGTGGSGGSGGGGGGGGCEMGYTGPDCTDCATGYQDKDGNDTCTLGCDAEGSVALNCGDNGTCDDSDGTRLCVCEAPWTGPTCEACAEGYELRNGFCDPLLPEVAGLRYRWDPDRDASVNAQNEVTAINNLASGAFALVSANGERPTLQAQAIGRRSAIVFDAVGEKLTSVMNTGVFSSSAYTAFVVFSPSDTSIRSVIGAGSGSSWGMWLVSGTTNLSVTLREPAGSTGGQTVTMDRPSGTPVVVRIARLNNVLQASAIEGDDLRGIEQSIVLTTTATNEDLQLALGAGPGTSNFRGAIGEVLVFDSTVSGADTTKILSYLKEKWIPRLPQ